jgi:hypothetical protein
VNLLDIHRDEWSKVTLTWLMSALLAMGYTIGWSAIHSMLVKRLGVGFLPYSYIGIAVLGMLGSSVYLVFADTVRRAPLLIAFASVTAIALGVSRLLVESRFVGGAEFTPSLILFFTIVLLAQGIGNSTLGTQVWTIIGDVLRPGRARQLYPLIGTSGTVGGILGGLSIGALVKEFGTADLVVVWAISVACLIPLTLLLQARHGAELKGGRLRSKAPPTGGRLANYREGWRHVTGSRLVQVISLIALMFWITGSLQDFQYTRIMNQTFASEEALASYYGYYSIAFNVTGMVIQFGVAGYILSRIGGVGRGLVVLPLTTLAGFGLVAIDFAFLPGLALRYAWDIVGMTIQGNAYNLALNGVPSAVRGRARGFIEGLINPLGGIGGGLLILGLNALPASVRGSGMTDIVTWAGVAAALSWFVISLRAKAAYTDSVLHNLGSKDRRTFLDAIECLEERGNARAIAKLMDVVQSTDRDTRATAMQTLARLSHLPGLRHIARALRSDDEATRLDAARAVRSFRDIVSHPFLATYFRERMQVLFTGDTSREVRAEAARYLIEHRPPEEVPRFVAEVLAGSEPEVKVKVVETLPTLDLDYADFAMEHLFCDPDPALRAALATALWPVEGRREDATAILQTLIDGQDSKERLAGWRSVVVTGAGALFAGRSGLSDPAPQVRVMAALAMLTNTAEAEPSETAVAVILDQAAEPASRATFRNDILPLLPGLREAALDALLLGTMSLPPARRQAAAESLGDFRQVFEHSLYGVD